MIKSFSLVLFVLIFLTKINYSQTIELRGKVYDEKKNPVKNFTLRFSTIGSITTTNSGEFIIELPDNITSAEIETTNKDWTILYPIDKKILIPNDKNSIIKIVVTSTEAQQAERLEYAAKNYSKLEALLKDIGVAKDELKNLVENYIQKEAANYDVQKDSLRDAILNEKKHEKFDLISRSPLNYILKLQDVKDIFKLFTQIAFYDSGEMKIISKSINDYNSAFNEINNNKYSFQKDVLDYWEDKYLSENLVTTIDYALDEIHKPYILKLNDYLVGVAKILTGQITDAGEKEKLRKSIAESIISVVHELEVRIPILDRKANNLIISLKDST